MNRHFLTAFLFMSSVAIEAQNDSVASEWAGQEDEKAVAAIPLVTESMQHNNSPATERKARSETDKKKQIDNKPAGEKSAREVKKTDYPLVKDEQRRGNQKRKSATVEDVMADFLSFIEGDPFYSRSEIAIDSAKIERHIKNLNDWNDRKSYIQDKSLGSYLRSAKDTLDAQEMGIESFIDDYLKSSSGYNEDDAPVLRNRMRVVLHERIESRRSQIDKLDKEMNDSSDKTGEDGFWDKYSMLVICGGVVIALVILLFFITKSRVKRDNRIRHTNNPGNSAPGMVVRRKTTSILKKQSLENVIDNPEYIRIDCGDFCHDSAVRRIYLKNSCVIDIYNMYADDLRNPDNPNEDGCFVLGRWVCDNETKEYYVSLENIVRPGDDAVLSEYELNFGGKIKMKADARLRKLRKETNLQYDLTCWVHSHPGLGVFFSNADNNVQMQLKNATHPLFLVAIVVDILTPEQELGFFTFKRDGSVNSKAELTKMYSLEELYRKALESGRNLFQSDNYFNVLGEAVTRSDNLCGIELSNGAIIDMDMIKSQQPDGTMAYAHGFLRNEGLKGECVVEKISKEEKVSDNECVGCYVVASHCSIPTLRRTLADKIASGIHFVMVCSTADDRLTVIPISHGELSTDDNTYGEYQFEDLKIWTRRKR